MALRIGQKVVCIDDGAHMRYIPAGYPTNRFTGDMDGLKEGNVYTVRGCRVFYGIPIIDLEEINRRGNQFDGTPAGYAAARFRPVTDISIFTAMLKTQKTDA